MNETMNALLTRRSVRKYSPEMPKREDLEQIIQAGLYAASGKGGQSSIILAVTDKALRDQMMEMNRKVGGWEEGFDPFYGAPAVLVVAYNKGDVYTYPGGRVDSGAEDAAIVATHMILAAYDQGVDSCWLNRFDPDQARELLVCRRRKRC